MNVAVITGTEVKGCTYRIKEIFLDTLRENSDLSLQITEFYLPKDSPHFCTGCKVCFMQRESLCPHASSIEPIWAAIMGADLVVFAYPVYALRAPGQLKALLDHFCCHWMAHRPESAMFTKRAAILTQSIGAPNRGAQKDVKTSLSWMGVSSIRTLGFGLREGVIWDELSEKRRGAIEKKVRVFADGFLGQGPAAMGLSVKMKFVLCKSIQRSQLKKGGPVSPDLQHYLDRGWVQRKTGRKRISKR